jgi:hypothetical protein
MHAAVNLAEFWDPAYVAKCQCHALPRAQAHGADASLILD